MSDTTNNAAVMNQYAGNSARAESPLHHVNFGQLAAKGNKSGGVVLREVKLQGHLTLRGNAEDASFLAGCEKALGVAVPTQPLTSNEKDGVSIRWMSPDRWLIVLPADKVFDTEKALRANLTGHFQVVSVGGGQTILELSGENAVDVLHKSCPVDLHPSVFPVGKVVGTVFAKAGGIVLRRSSEDTWELVIRRSFADYIWLWLQDASREYGLVISA